ncbi:MAG: hypothetical protein ACREGG_00790 [Candidatus Saccharimonadales bacterium]
MRMIKPLACFLFFIGAVSGIVGCASERAFIVPTDSEYLRIALEDEHISKKFNAPFLMKIEADGAPLKLNSSGLMGGMWDSKTFQIQPSVMMNNVLNAIAEISAISKPPLTMKLRLKNYNYARLGYGLGTNQPAVWLAIEFSLFEQDRLIDRGTYVSRAQCGPPFHTGAFWQSANDAHAAYAVATYKALIVALEQAVHQKRKSLATLRDRSCIDYGGDESWDLRFN